MLRVAIMSLIFADSFLNRQRVSLKQNAADAISLMFVLSARHTYFDFALDPGRA
jgi:hypothetical protein